MNRPSGRRLTNLPTLITYFRIVLIPVILFLMVQPGRAFAAFACFLYAVAAVSDLLDGYLARKQGVVTALGVLLDPLADKLLAVTALVILVSLDRVSPWIVSLILVREISITALRGIAVTEGIVISASSLGKVKSTTLNTGIGALILYYDFLWVNWYAVGTVIIVVATGLSLYSGFDYVKGFAKGALRSSSP